MNNSIKKDIRAFFAIGLPKSLQQQLASIISLLEKQFTADDICFIKPQNLHITLQFLGKLQLEDLTTLIHHAGQEVKNFSAFAIEFGSMELFPSTDPAKVISIAIKFNPQLTTLANTIGTAIITTGYDIDARAFRAHLTIGRIQRAHPITLPHINLALPNLLVNQVILFQSEPDALGSSYTPLATLPLGKI